MTMREHYISKDMHLLAVEQHLRSLSLIDDDDVVVAVNMLWDNVEVSYRKEVSG